MQVPGRSKMSGVISGREPAWTE